MSAQLKLPANHTALHEDAMMYTTDGEAADTDARAAVAVGGAAALLVVGGVAARAIRSVVGGRAAWPAPSRTASPPARTSSTARWPPAGTS